MSAAVSTSSRNDVLLQAGVFLLQSNVVLNESHSISGGKQHLSVSTTQSKLARAASASSTPERQQTKLT
jgi:hypothetical protein